MSELASLLRGLRGSQTQAWVARQTGLSLRTIQRVEDGSHVTIESLRAMARCYHTSPPDYARLLIAYLRHHLKQDFQLLHVTPAPTGSPSPSSVDKLVALILDIPPKYQDEILRAAARPEVLESIRPINDLYDSLTRSVTKKRRRR